MAARRRGRLRAAARGRRRASLFPPPGAALGRGGGGPLRAATVDVRRDDVLVMAAAPLDAPALAELAASGGGERGAPALLTARFERGALEPRRPPEGAGTPLYTGRTMKTEIHPEYVEAHVRCTCGNEFTTRSTQPEIRVEICSNCHPFYTGKQKLVDTGGRVERFKRRAAKRAR